MGFEPPPKLLYLVKISKKKKRRNYINFIYIITLDPVSDLNNFQKGGKIFSERRMTFITLAWEIFRKTTREDNFTERGKIPTILRYKSNTA